TIDDAAGEAFDKGAAILDLGFPGGPAVEQAARNGNPQAYAFPRAFLHEDRLRFSFRGLKTPPFFKGYRQGKTEGGEPLSEARRADLAASFQEAVVDVLVAKAGQALVRTGATRLAVGGGVAANRRLREALQHLTGERRGELFIPPLELCTDNA